MNLLKKITYTMLALAAVLFTACSDDSDDRFAPGSEAVAHFTVSMGGDTRAIGDAGSVNSITAAVYDGGKLVYETSPVALDAAKQDGIDLTLIVGHEYQIIFWAQNGEKSPYFFDPNAPTVNVNYEAFLSGGFTQMEKLDAFYDAQTIRFTGNSTTGTVNLVRPLAMLNFADPDVQPLSGTHIAELTLTNVPTSFSPFADTKFADADDFKFTFGDFPGEKLTAGEGSNTKEYFYVTCNYLFPSATATAATLELKSGSEVLKTTSIPAGCISLVANTRTNVLGSIVQAPIQWSIWDGETKTEPAIDGESRYVIDEASDIAWMVDYASTLAVSKTYILTTNIDMASKSGLAPIQLPDGSTIEGGEHTIKGISSTGALFGNVSNVTVKNLTVEDIQVSATTHVGAIANTINGICSFENVNVSNSMVKTTSGAAGGIVGYISRKSEKDRAEELNVTFTDCTINACTILGTAATGHFVGLFSGYDNNETLTFTECAYTAPDVQMLANNSVSPYREGNEAAWLAGNDYTAFNNFLGNEKYYRGTVMYGDNRFIPKWDGTTTVEPLKDGTTILIYSPFDLASMQSKKGTSNPKIPNFSGSTQYGAVTFMSDVDLNGAGSDGIMGNGDDYAFNPIRCISTLEGNNKTIYNLRVEMIHDGNYGAAFIAYTTGTTTHKNLTFDGAYIHSDHNADIPIPAYGNEKDGGAGNAYAGTLVATVGGTYTVKNITAKNGTVSAVCKIGGLIGRVSGEMYMEGCSVDKYQIQNYEANVPNYYNIPPTSFSSYTVHGMQWWYTQGECGGLIGYIKSTETNIENCSVTNTNMDCYGQDNKEVQANVYSSGSFDKNNPYQSIDVAARGKTVIAGRHVNQFIGDIVSERSEDGSNYVVTIKDYTVSGNTYFKKPAENQQSVYSHIYKRVNNGSSWRPNYVYSYCDVVGCAYYVGVDVNINMIIFKIQKHIMHTAGTLTFNKKGESAVTITEAVGSGNDIAWTGGDFSVSGLSGKSSYPTAPPESAQ